MDRQHGQKFSRINNRGAGIIDGNFGTTGTSNVGGNGVALYNNSRDVTNNGDTTNNNAESSSSLLLNHYGDIENGSYECYYDAALDPNNLMYDVDMSMETMAERNKTKHGTGNIHHGNSSLEPKNTGASCSNKREINNMTVAPLPQAFSPVWNGTGDSHSSLPAVNANLNMDTGINTRTIANDRVDKRAAAREDMYVYNMPNVSPQLYQHPHQHRHHPMNQAAAPHTDFNVNDHTNSNASTMLQSDHHASPRDFMNVSKSQFHQAMADTNFIAATSSQHSMRSAAVGVPKRQTLPFKSPNSAAAGRTIVPPVANLPPPLNANNNMCKNANIVESTNANNNSAQAMMTRTSLSKPEISNPIAANRLPSTHKMLNYTAKIPTSSLPHHAASSFTSAPGTSTMAAQPAAKPISIPSKGLSKAYLTIPQAIALVRSQPNQQQNLISKRKQNQSTDISRAKSSSSTLPYAALLQSRYRLYARKPAAIPTAEQIAAAIPPSASSIFHILDRRIDFDSFNEGATFYELLRGWVRDDPYRRSMSREMDLMRCVLLPSQGRKDVGVENDTATCSDVEELRQLELQEFFSKREMQDSSRQRINLLDNATIGNSERTDMKSYLEEYIQKGTVKRKRRNRLLKRRDQVCLKRLERTLGIKVKDNLKKSDS